MNHAPAASNVGAHHGMLVFGAARKEKPGGGNAGSDLFCYRSLRFQVCGLAVARCARGRGAACFYCPAKFCSCSSTFLFFSKVFKFNRTLCDFASFSVRLRTHSSLGGDDLYEARHMPGNEKLAETARYRCEINFRAKLASVPVKAPDNAFTRSCSRDE